MRRVSMGTTMAKTTLPLLLLLLAWASAQVRPQRYIPQRYEDYVVVDTTTQASSTEASSTTQSTTTTTATTTTTEATTPQPLPDQNSNAQPDLTTVPRIPDDTPIALPEPNPGLGTPSPPLDTQSPPLDTQSPPLDTWSPPTWPGYDGNNQIGKPVQRPTWNQGPSPNCMPFCGPRPMINPWHDHWGPHTGYHNPFGPGYIRHHKYLRVAIGRFVPAYHH